MNLTKLIFKSAVLVASVFAFTACSDDDNKEPDYWVPPFSTTQGAYILNNGNWGSNDASIAYYDKETQAVSAANVFESVNKGLKLGDIAQDILVTDDKMYISVSESGIIYITDHKAAVIDSIISEKSDQFQQPRYFTTYGDYVYVTYYDGYVGRINKKNNKLDDKQVAVGPNPEQLKIANGKIYVANSGGYVPGYHKSVSVIDINTFTKKYDIPVTVNPTKVEVDRQGNIYVISNGDYGDIKSALQIIDTDEDVVNKTLGEASYMCISPQGDKLYYLNSVWSSSHFDSKVYDTTTEKVLDANFIDESVSFTGAPSSLSIDPQTGNIYIGSSLYLVIGEMHIISPSTGKLIKRFSTGGLNPMGAYFIK